MFEDDVTRVINVSEQQRLTDVGSIDQKNTDYSYMILIVRMLEDDVTIVTDVTVQQFFSTNMANPLKSIFLL